MDAVSAYPTKPSFSFSFQNAYVNINRIMSVAARLSEAGHYASQQIKQISTQLDQEWKSFAAALDERSTILAMSAVFHQKAEQVRPRELPWLLVVGKVLGQARGRVQGCTLSVERPSPLWETLKTLPSSCTSNLCSPTYMAPVYIKKHGWLCLSSKQEGTQRLFTFCWVVYCCVPVCVDCLLHLHSLSIQRPKG